MSREDQLMPLKSDDVGQHLGKGCRHNKTRYAIIRESMHNGMYVKLDFGGKRAVSWYPTKDVEVYKENGAPAPDTLTEQVAQ
jgi:hypothetical protein